MKHYWPGFLMLLAAVGVYAYRNYRYVDMYHQPPVRRSAEGEVSIQKRVFEEVVLTPNAERFQQSLTHLVVFVDPEKHCTGYLWEVTQWAAPREIYDGDVFSLTLVVPDTLEEATLASFRDAFQLAEADFLQYSEKDALGLFGDLGILKVFYSLPNGVEWVEGGEENPVRQEAFLDRLLVDIEAVMVGG